MKIVETEHLLLREIDSAQDAGFVSELLNSPKFIKYIGDRGVRTVEQASDFIENRYRQSYVEHGFGLYTVELKKDSVQIGICGFVKRGTLPDPDIGFAFLPDFEGQGYGFESAAAVLKYGRDTLGMKRVLAITSLDNDVSVALLKKLGFTEEGLTDSHDGEKLRLFSCDQ